MARPAEDVTNTELAMLQILWQQGTATRRQIMDELYPGGDTAHYATVQKLLQRLETKGFVHHTRQQGVLVFTAAIGREELIHRRLRDVAAKLCDGSLIPLLMNLVRTRPLTKPELEELQDLVKDLSRQKKHKNHNL